MPWHCKIKFVVDPFSGKLCTQVKVRLTGTPGKEWDSWAYTSDLKCLMANSCYRPRAYHLVLV